MVTKSRRVTIKRPNRPIEVNCRLHLAVLRGGLTDKNRAHGTVVHCRSHLFLSKVGGRTTTASQAAGSGPGLPMTISQGRATAAQTANGRVYRPSKDGQSALVMASATEGEAGR